MTPATALIGHDGWADGRFGNWKSSNVELNDYTRIRDLKGLLKSERLVVIQRLAEEAAKHIRKYLPVTLDQFENVILLTHVPPFAEACWHEGQMSTPDYLPHFSSRVVGEAILESSKEFPNRKITVLCGHSHGGGYINVSPSIEVYTGASEYGKPQVSEI